MNSPALRPLSLVSLRPFSRRRTGGFSLSPGLWTIGALAVLSSLGVLFWRVPPTSGITMWTFARNHFTMYGPDVETWNATHRPPVQIRLLSDAALDRRIFSGFTSHTPVAGVVEVTQNIAARAFIGPLGDVGFVDLTDLIRQEGLLERVNAASFSPWTSRGHIFGLPHDVHPVMLAYRADLVEAAGIAVDGVETWEDFFRVMRPLQGKRDADGRPERFLLAVDETRSDLIVTLLFQAGGRMFDANGQPALDHEINARVLASVVAWCAGPDPVAVNVEDDASGNQAKRDGLVVATFMPDWLTGVTRRDLPGLTGRLKLMPLPAWEPGGRRTTGAGGTMLGLTRAGGPVGPRWEFAKHLYFSPEVARELYRTNGIISPVKTLWNDPVYDAPDPYFGGQPVGRLYVNLAPQVTPRMVSPYQSFAQTKIREAGSLLREWAETHRQFTVAALEPEARRLLTAANAEVLRQMKRNVFLRPERPDPR